MIFKLISFPFWVLSKIMKIAGGSIKLLFIFIFDLLQFFINHLIGAVFGALIGFFFGRNHIGVHIFNHKKKHHRKAAHSFA